MIHMRKHTFAVLTGILFTLSLLIWGNPVKAMTPDNSKATWLWHTDQIQQQPAEILAFLASKKVTVLYLQVNQDIPMTDYAAFIQQAGAQGVSVHALGGSPSWLSSKNGEKKRVGFYKWIDTYQKSIPKEARFTGIHLDVEPYLRDTWNTDYKTTVNSYQSVLIEGKQEAEKLGVTFGIDIPFWFDERLYDNNYGRGVLSEWLIDTADQVTIMAYRNKATGPNSIVSLTETELMYAEKVKKQVVIGVETLHSSEGAHLSFYGKGEVHMNQTLADVKRNLREPNSLGGFAIHSLDGWRLMK